jgi:sigma-B regulation protein RsbU (phosphoserine phosphatase)
MMTAPPPVSPHPLKALHVLRPDPLNGMAASWLELGAGHVGLWAGDSLIVGWPGSSIPPGTPLSAPIKINGRLSGELRVYGSFPKVLERRVKADADLIAHLATLEAEINTMTLELIDNQDQLLALYDLTQSTRSRFEMGEVLYLLARESARLVKAEQAFALLYIGSGEPVVAHVPTPRFSENTLFDYFDRIRVTGQKILYKSEVPPEKSRTGVQSLLVMPIQVRGEIVAILGLINKHGGFNAPDSKLVNAIADQAGAQIETVLLYQETLSQTKLQTEMELAQQVQARLLPQQPPPVAGLDVFCGSLAASQVGGDFYDFYDQPGQPFRFAIGDITGKGMPAALIMAMSRTLLRSKVRSLENPSPADILGSANDDMYEDFTETGMFATAFLGQYHQRERLLYYANCGHSPVVYCPAGGPAYIVEADSPPLGVLPMSLAENRMMAFQPGDLLVAATDGFSEARNAAGELFGYDRLLALIEQCAAYDAHDLGHALFNAVAAFSSGHLQDDDQTLIVIKGV